MPQSELKLKCYLEKALGLSFENYGIHQSSPVVQLDLTLQFKDNGNPKILIRNGRNPGKIMII